MKISFTGNPNFFKNKKKTAPKKELVAQVKPAKKQEVPVKLTSTKASSSEPRLSGFTSGSLDEAVETLNKKSKIAKQMAYQSLEDFLKDMKKGR